MTREQLGQIAGGAYCFVLPKEAGDAMREMALELLAASAPDEGVVVAEGIVEVEPDGDGGVDSYVRFDTEPEVWDGICTSSHCDLTALKGKRVEVIVRAAGSGR